MCIIIVLTCTEKMQTLCWAPPQSPGGFACVAFNVLAGIFWFHLREPNRRDTNSSSGWYLAKHNRHNRWTRLSYRSSVARVERDVEQQKLSPDVSHRKSVCVCAGRGSGANNVCELLMTGASGPMWRKQCLTNLSSRLSLCDLTITCTNSRAKH